MHKERMVKKRREKKLSTRIALTAGGILTVVFIILIFFTVSNTQKVMSGMISDSVGEMVKSSGQQVQQVIISAESGTTDIEAYLKKAYLMSGQGKRNMLGQMFDEGVTKEDVIRSRNFISGIYGTPLSEFSADVEKYIVESARQLTVSNEDIDGVCVQFEPNAFEEGMKEYSFYIGEEDGDAQVQPYSTYEKYSQEPFYQAAVAAKQEIIYGPFDNNGKQCIMVSTPIYNEEELKCVVSALIRVENFSKMNNKNDKYPSMYTSVLNQEGTIIYDSESNDNITKNLSEFVAGSVEMKVIKDGFAAETEFSAPVTKNGEKMMAFFYPIHAADNHWWSYTALTQEDMNRAVGDNAKWMILISIAALIIIAGSILLLLRQKLKPINQIAEAAEKIADGNLDISLSSNSNDEIGRLSRAFGTTVERLRGIIGDANYLLDAISNGNFNVRSRSVDSYVGEFTNMLLSMRKIVTNLTNTMQQINQAADQVSSGSGQVSDGAQALSQGTTEQASVIEELAATTNEILERVQTNAENSRHASTMVSEVGDKINQSNQQMQEMSVAMEKISRHSDEIRKIIKTIEDIAFQTNILSLNAAVEATRAGEAGKGFAVVAAEVRTLADKSTQASKNIAELIDSTIKAVENGAQLAEQTAGSLQVVVRGAAEVTVNMDRISEASREQAGSIAEVSHGIDEISNVVQTNSATAEESAASSEELSSQAYLLKDLVDKFELRQEEGSITLPHKTTKALPKF